MRRFVLRAFALIAALATIAVIGTYLSMRRSLPMVDGTTSVTGISAPIDIVRDADAIPHIFAATKADALFGLGYAHEQDRLWQMEFQRRIGFGRLCEIFGAAALPQDRFLRTVGFGRAARAAWENTPEWARQQVNAYVSGVNAFLATHHGTGLPLEFSLLRFEPEAWSGPDVLVWVKMMAWDLSSNYLLELLRQDLIRTVGAERMAALMPPYATAGLSIVPSRPGGSSESGESGGPNDQRSYLTHATDPTYPALISALSQGVPAVSALLLGGGTTEALGSNNWVVDGTRTA